MGIFSLLDDPKSYLFMLLLSLPGILLALCGHEAAHGWVALKCGDPTAKLSGRVTLNPARHLDPVGFLCMLLVGFGWARPVPVNPLNFRRARRDDLKVSLAGICANLLMCLIGFLMLTGLFSLALSRVPSGDFRFPEETIYRTEYAGETYLVAEEQKIVLTMEDTFRMSSGIWSFGNGSGVYYNVTDLLIEPVLGRFWSYAYQMIERFMMVNLSLAVFNLIPVPPLDGYHVLNDLLLKRPLFAPQKAARIGSTVLLVLILLGNVSDRLDVISIVIGFIQNHVFDGLTSLAYGAASILSIV